MKLKNWKQTSIPITPNYLKDKIVFATSTSLNDREISIFNLSMSLIIKQIEMDKIEYDSLTKVTVIFTETDEVTIDLRGDNLLGVYIPIIIYRVNEWREGKFTDLNLLTIILEELCHCYFHYEEEYFVKLKVIEIITKYDSSIPKDHIYKKEYLESCKEI